MDVLVTPTLDFLGPGVEIIARDMPQFNGLDEILENGFFRRADPKAAFGSARRKKPFSRISSRPLNWGISRAMISTPGPKKSRVGVTSTSISIAPPPIWRRSHSGVQMTHFRNDSN